MTCFVDFISIVCSALTASYLLWLNEVLLAKLALTTRQLTVTTASLDNYIQQLEVNVDPLGGFSARCL